MLSNILKKLREQHHLSQANVAAQIQIPKGTYVTYEYGTREPNIEMINKLADFYGVTTDYLLGRETGEPEALDRLAYEFNMSSLERKIVDNYLSLPLDMRDDLMDFLYKSVQEVCEETANKVKKEPSASANISDAVLSAEEEYEKSLGFAQSTKSSVLNTTGEKRKNIN